MAYIRRHEYISNFRFIRARVGPCRAHAHHPGLGDLSAVGDDDGFGGGPRAAANLFNGFDDVHAARDFPKHDVLAVEPVRLDGAQEELRAIRARARVGHAQRARASVLEREVLVL